MGRASAPKWSRIPAIVAGLLLVASAAQATSYSWNVASGDWFTATNWSPNGVPGLADSASIANGGTCTLNSSTTVTALSLSNGTFAGSGTLDVLGVMTWTGGVIQGSGAVNANGGLALGGGPVTRQLSGRNLVHNAGIATFSGDSRLSMGSGGTFTNNATVEFVNDGGSACCQGILGNFVPSTVVNNGTFRKLTGNSGTSFITVDLLNNGVIDVQSGTLSIANGTDVTSASGSTHTVAAGATLTFGGGFGGASLTFAAGSSISGAGTVQFGLVDADVLGSYSVTGDTRVVGGGTRNFSGTVTDLGALTVSSGTANFNPGAAPAMSTLVAVTVNGGTVNFTTGATVAAPTLTVSSGTLGGSDPATVAGVMTWTGGIIQGSGAVNANGGLALGGAGTRQLSGRNVLNNLGTATFTGDSRLSMGTGGTFTNNATVEFANDAGGACCQGILGNFVPSAVVNNGTFRKLTGNTGTSQITVDLINNGVIDVQSGTLSIANGTDLTSSSGSTFTISGGATLAFGGGFGGALLTFAAGSSVSGGGAVQFGLVDADVLGSYAVTGQTRVVGGGTRNFSGTVTDLGAVTATGGTVNFNPGAAPAMSTLASVTINGGTANVTTGTAVTAPLLSLSNGTLGGTDPVTVTGVMTWTGGIIQGSGAVTANGGLALGGVATRQLNGRNVVHNLGTATFAGDSRLFVGSGGSFTNNATIEFATDGGATLQGFLFGIGGSAVINTGTMRKLTGNTGTSQVQAPFTNSGTVECASGTLSFSSTYTQSAGTTRTTGGTINASQPVSLQGGTLEGVGLVTAPVNNTGGVVAPGLSAGLLNETGAYTQGGAGAFNAEIGGLTVGSQYDRLAVSGLATLGGTLNIALIGGYEPDLGDTFTIMTFGSRSGDFAGVNGAIIGNGKMFQKTVNATTVVLAVVPEATPTSTVTATGTTTSTATATVTPTSTATATATASSTPTSTDTATPTPTATPTATLPAGCPATPLGTCYAAGKSSLMLKDSSTASRTKLKWKWSKGVAALAQGDFGTPTNDTAYALCVYDETAGVPVFTMGVSIGAAGLCGPELCWGAVGTKGYSYKNLDGNADGVTALRLLGGSAGKPKVQLKGRGAALPLPAPISGSAFFAQDPAVIVQLHSLNPDACWSSTFASAGTKKNDNSQFKASAP